MTLLDTLKKKRKCNRTGRGEAQNVSVCVCVCVARPVCVWFSVFINFQQQDPGLYCLGAIL